VNHTVSHTENLFDFFQGQVLNARSDLDLSLSEDASLYLANLLVDNTRADRPQRPQDTLAELHAAAAHAAPGAQAATYRALGDHSLYTVGYFRDSLDRKLVGADYYADMGAAAYHRTDQVLKCWFSDAFGPIFGELATRFRDCVSLLDRIRSTHEDRPEAIERLYQEWMATGDPVLAARLRRIGLLLPSHSAEATDGEPTIDTSVDERQRTH
jgi:hypothetical protein